MEQTMGSAERLARSEALWRELCELAAHTHAALAQLAAKVAAFDSARGWDGIGIRSCAHWLSINAGFDHHTGEELVRVGHALSELPRVSDAFACGELSFDKVRAISAVAAAADEEVWLELARQASGSQLSRICREVRRATRADAPDRSDAHLAHRGVWWHWDDDGMLRLRAALPPEDGGLVVAALEAIRERRVAAAATADRAVPDPSDDPRAAQRADALAEVCQVELTAAREQSASGPGGQQMVVHVDVGVLTGEDSGGRCHVENGPALSAAAARRLACDVEVVAMTERAGLPIDVGRARRIVSGRLRRALRGRDSGCRFPGCGIPARQSHAHHIQHWAEGGRTDLSNLVLLCGFHHRRLHDGVYRIRSLPDGDRRFESADGRPIAVGATKVAPVRSAVALRELVGIPHVEADSARAGDGGARLDLDHAVQVIAAACSFARSRAPTARAQAP